MKNRHLLDAYSSKQPDLKQIKLIKENGGISPLQHDVCPLRALHETSGKSEVTFNNNTLSGTYFQVNRFIQSRIYPGYWGKISLITVQNRRKISSSGDNRPTIFRAVKLERGVPPRENRASPRPFGVRLGALPSSAPLRSVSSR